MCDHENLSKALGEMESTSIEGLYAIPFKCLDCNKTVYEQYSYNGIVEDKNIENG